MSSLTTRLALKRPDGTDPFLRTDFVNNWNKLDQYPGIFICTSGTRPTWGDGQIGMAIYETDTKREYKWDGAAWFLLNPVERMPGEITMYVSTLIPTGWLACDGAAVSRATYADLFAIVGITYGPGNGSTTFNVPDMRSRSPLGSGAGPGLTNRTLGQGLGEEAHVMSVGEMATHNHGGGTGVAGSHSHGGATGVGTAHNHNIYRGTGAGSSTTRLAPGNSGDGGFMHVENEGGHIHGIGADGDHAHTIATQGSATAANVMHPSRVVNFIIKI